jgi:hypothetical protein
VFGIDLVSLIIHITVSLGAIVTILGGITLGLTVRYRRRDRRFEAFKSSMSSELFARLNEDDPDWRELADGMSRPERTATLAVAKRLLRQLEGREQRELRAFVAALGLDERKLRQGIESSKLYTVLRTLSWLALLDRPSVVDAALRTCTWTSDVRIALARVLHENDDPRRTRTGVELLLWNGTEPLSVFGLDTLYRIANADPSYLLSTAESDARAWTDTLLVQVLRTVRHCQATIKPSSIEWVTACLDHASAEVRREALLVLTQFGWSSRLRSAVDIESYFADDSPAVRRAAYRLVGAWDEDGAADALVAAVRNESDDRSRLVGARELRRLGWQLEADASHSPRFRRVWTWVSVQEQFARRNP